jgi:predicted ATP-dependent protease
MPPISPLSADALYSQCDPDQFDFDTTEHLEDAADFVGQSRAKDAMAFGLDMDKDGYNIFVLGMPGAGRHEFAKRFIEDAAKDRPTPGDWFYVNNFDNPQQPHAISLPAGAACLFKSRMERLISSLQAAIPAAFEGDDFRVRRQSIQEEFTEEQGKIFETLQEEAKSKGVAIMQTPSGIAFAPVRDGEVVGPEEFQKLEEEEQARLKGVIEELGKKLQEAMQSAPTRMRDAKEKIQELEQGVSKFASETLIQTLIREYESEPDVVAHLERLKSDVVDNVDLFLPSQPQGPAGPAGPAGPTGSEQAERPAVSRRPEDDPAIKRYGVNVVVDRRGEQGAPIIFNENPAYPFLVGQIEHKVQYGALTTDFNLVKAGALHQANGGYIVIDARKILSQPYAWDGLKRSLRQKDIRIEAVAQGYSPFTTTGLEPDPIPLEVKVVLIGDAQLYYMLQSADPEFRDHFKVTAELDDRVDRSVENDRHFARLLGGISRRENLKPLSPGGVARIIEQGARDAADAEKVSTRISQSADLLRESDYWSAKNGAIAISRDDVEKAIAAREHRVSGIRDRAHEGILREIINIETSGAKVGQINGLAVMQIGDFAFGRPSRITARLRVGAGRVIDIEREVAMGGPSHSKGVLILTSYLASHFAIEHPLSLAASLVFEQSYSGVDGDSASSTELYALLSALSDKPINQSIAVTGSVDQYGNVQAIGGVNEKIEGFFDICNARGLTGDHGVMIPPSNIKHLMLRQDVIDAAKAGKFHIYSPQSIDEGIEVLTGIPAGMADADGLFPEGSINHLVRERLIDFARIRHAFHADSGWEIENG